MLYQKKNNKLEPLTGSTLYAEAPIGTVIASFLAIAPSGYIKADDTVYTKAQYPELYERIPDVFKDTTNETFTIDLREVALKGIGLSSLTTDHYSSTGLTLGEFIEDRVQQHNHGLRNYNQTSSSTGYTVGTGEKGFVGNAYTYKNGEYTSGSVGRYGATTEVKSVGVNYFIKAKHVALPIDIMDAVSEIYATKVEADVVIEQGEIPNYPNSWYKKYASGILEQWFTEDWTITISANGSIYKKVDFPIQFADNKLPLEITYRVKGVYGSSPNVWVGSNNGASSDGNDHFTAAIYSFTAYNSVLATLHIHAVGFWK